MPRKILIGAALLSVLALAVAVSACTAPLVVLHYAADARQAVVFFFNDNNNITKDTLSPGSCRHFRTALQPQAGYVIEVSLPLASHDGVEIRPPFSRVDVYIGADARIARTVVKTDFLARFRDDQVCCRNASSE